MKRFFKENTAAACSGFAANNSNNLIKDKTNFMNFNAEEPFEALLNKVKTAKILNKIRQSKEKRAQDESMV